MATKEFDVIVIGAGAAGLNGALEIALTGKKVAVIEARDRTGGRIATIWQNGIPVELGAEFIHGDLPLTKALAKNAGTGIYAVEGSIWQQTESGLREQEDFIEDYRSLERKLRGISKDKTVSAFLNEELHDEKYRELRLSVCNYVEGYYAGDIKKASVKAFHKEVTKEDEAQYRPEAGYRQLLEHLETTCRKSGVEIFLSQPVLALHWKAGEATAVTEQGEVRGRKALLTVPVGVLQNETIKFNPALPSVKEAARALGYGHAMKIVLLFEKAFWEGLPSPDEDLTDLGFLFTREEIPTWWTQFPKKHPMLTGWLAGPKAEALQCLPKEEVIEKAMASLSRALQTDVIHLNQMLVASHCYNWSADPFSAGAYSYEVVGGSEKIRQLRQPVEDTLFFGGEGLQEGPLIGTVEGALRSGREASHRLIAAFYSGKN